MRLKFRKITLPGVLLGILAWCGFAAGQEVSMQQLLDGLKNPSRWLSYSGDYSGQRHSPLTQIAPSNARSSLLRDLVVTQIAIRMCFGVTSFVSIARRCLGWSFCCWGDSWSVSEAIIACMYSCASLLSASG